MRIARLLVIAALLMIPVAARAQEMSVFRLDGPTARRAGDSTVTSAFLVQPGIMIEGAGLRTWTIPMIEDSMAVHAPGIRFWSQSCQDALQHDLRIFPQSTAMQADGDSAVTVFVAVIEPQDSALVTVRKFKGNGKRSVAPWTQLVTLTRTRVTSVKRAMQAAIEARSAGFAPALTRGTRADSTEFVQVWSALAAHHAAKDFATARRLLVTSPNVNDRLAAVVIVSAFDDRDEAWHALAGALLDQNDLVRDYARAALQAFANDLARPVDWRGGAAEVHALLQGSDLWSFPETLDLLVKTGVGPELAAPLLKNGGHAVLLFAGARNMWARGPAQRFLRAIRGEDLGGNPEAWRGWIATL